MKPFTSYWRIFSLKQCRGSRNDMVDSAISLWAQFLAICISLHSKTVLHVWFGLKCPFREKFSEFAVTCWLQKAYRAFLAVCIFICETSSSYFHFFNTYSLMHEHFIEVILKATYHIPERWSPKQNCILFLKLYSVVIIAMMLIENDLPNCCIVCVPANLVNQCTAFKRFPRLWSSNALWRSQPREIGVE